MNTISEEYENLTVNVSPSPVIFLGAAVLTALTVFISTRKPIRAAANTPPIEAFIVLSLMLCIILLNSVGIAARSLDVEKKVDYMIRTDFAVVNKDSTNVQKGFTRREQGLSEKNIEDISGQPGVYDDSVVYKNTLDDMDVTFDFGARI